MRFRYHSDLMAAPLTRQRIRHYRGGKCPFCERRVALTFHHLIPKKLHRRTRFRKDFSREELNRGVDICRQCHDGIHTRYDEMTLFREFRTAESLAADPELARHFAWVSRQRVR